jgi:hypothetical protein
MKPEFLIELREFKNQIQSLKREVAKLNTERVSTVALRTRASALADAWVESLRSPLEHRYKVDSEVVAYTAEQMKQLHVLSRPNNLKSSYIKCLERVLWKFDDKFILPVQQTASDPESVLQLSALITDIPSAAQSSYLEEAIACAQAGHDRAAIVMGWCAAIDHMQKYVVKKGFDAFNRTSTAVKNQTSGKYKRWNKEFNITSEGELQTVFDTDLIVILENMNLLDGNQSDRLEACFMYRNQSAHPGLAPIEPAHVIAFFTDITRIVLLNPKFDCA